MRGPGGLSAAELIAVILGTGGGGRSAMEVAEDARRAARRSAGAVARRRTRSWPRPRASGAAKAARLAAAFELGRRSVAEWPTGRWTIRSPRDVFGPARGGHGPPRARGAAGPRPQHEERRPAGHDRLRRATCRASLVRVGELFRDAVRLDAAGVVLVHNHPSGDPTPSPDDLHLTAEAIAAGRLLDVDVLDHVVIGHDAGSACATAASPSTGARPAARSPRRRPRPPARYWRPGSMREQGSEIHGRDGRRRRHRRRRPGREPRVPPRVARRARRRASSGRRWPPGRPADRPASSASTTTCSPRRDSPRPRIGWFRDWEARVGGDCGFTRTGFLWIEPGDAAERRPRERREPPGAGRGQRGAWTRRRCAGLAPALAVADDEVAAWEPGLGLRGPVR